MDRDGDKDTRTGVAAMIKHRRAWCWLSKNPSKGKGGCTRHLKRKEATASSDCNLLIFWSGKRDSNPVNPSVKLDP